MTTQQSELPEYINCKSTVITHCDFYMHSLCQNTCSFALDIGGLGIGAADVGIVKLLNENKTSEDVDVLGDDF